MSGDRDGAPWYRVAGLGVVFACALVWPGRGEPHQSTEARQRAAQIDIRAPGAFDGADRSPRLARGVHYRVHATVLFPVISLPLVHRDDVGFASAAVQEYSTESERGIRTYELFSASFPERARGLNRTGFIREVVGLGENDVRWTAHFGALSSNPETSRAEVALDSDESVQSYTVMDGFTSRDQASSTETYLELRGSWSSAGLFYRNLMPVWKATAPRSERQSRLRTEVTHMAPLGFLGILQRSLGMAARDLRRRSAPRQTRYPFAHKGQVMYLDLSGHSLDAKRQRRFEDENLIKADAVVHRFDYRILDRERALVQKFRIWTELPADAGPRLAVPVVPLGFEFKAKSFLELEAIRSDSPVESTRR